MNFKNTILFAGMAIAVPLAHAAVDVPPNKNIPRIKLGGHAKPGPNQFALASESLASCTSRPFTADEFRRVAPRGTLTMVRTAGPTGRPVMTESVRLAASNDKPARTIPLAQYVAEINAVERFYNKHGFTLRRGALSLTRGERPQEGRAGCTSRDSLKGLRAAMPLVQYRLVDSPGGMGNGGLLGDNVEPPQTKPNPPGPGDVMGGVFKPGDLVMNRTSLTEAGRRLANMNLDVIPAMPFGRGIPHPKPMSGSCVKACSYELGKDAHLTPGAQLLLAKPDEVIFKFYGCRIQTLEANNSEKCPEIHKFFIREVTRRQEWEKLIDVKFFMANSGKVCDVIANEDKPGGMSNSELLYTFNETSTGSGSLVTGTQAGSFFDGVLHFSKSGIADCVLDVGSNSMFGAQFCLKYGTSNDYSPGKGFNIHNEAGVTTDVTLFGYTFDLVKGTAQVDWKQPVSPTSSVPIVRPVEKSTLPQKNETQHFEGPGATFPVGPIPLTIRTFADAKLSVGKPEEVFSMPAMMKGSPTVGKVGMIVTAGTDVSVGMDAAIDAFVLSAGISGKMSLLNNNLNGGITSFIAPAKNELTVEKAYTFDATMLKGSISAFVEVDLIIYSERYSVEIVRFPGTTKTWPLDVSTWGPAHAVLPESAQSGAVCK